LKIRWKHLLWLPVNGALAFLLPALMLGALGASQNMYYAAVVIACGALAVAYARKSGLRIGQSLKPGWALGIIFGVFIGLVFLSFAALSNPGLQNELDRPGAAQTIAKSAIFGIAIAFMATVLPFVIVWRAFGEDSTGLMRKSLIAVTAIVAVAAVTFLYSLGMPGSLPGTGPSGHEDLQANFTKTMMAGVPTLISGSPLAAPISHIFLQLSEAAAETGHPPRESAQQSPKTSSGRQDPTAGRERSTMEGIN
jgi:hypothetical protein